MAKDFISSIGGDYMAAWAACAIFYAVLIMFWILISLVTYIISITTKKSLAIKLQINFYRWITYFIGAVLFLINVYLFVMAAINGNLEEAIVSITLAFLVVAATKLINWPIRAILSLSAHLLSKSLGQLFSFEIDQATSLYSVKLIR